VAAEQDLLDSLTELVIEPVSIEGASQSFSVKSTVTQLSDFKNVSSEQVYVSVTLGEQTVEEYIDNVRVIFTGKGEHLIASYDKLGVYVTGPISAVEALRVEGVTVSVDIKGMEEGYYILSPRVDPEAYPDVEILSEAASVTLTDITADDEPDTGSSDEQEEIDDEDYMDEEFENEELDDEELGDEELDGEDF